MSLPGMRQGNVTQRHGPVSVITQSQLSYGKRGLGDKLAHDHTINGPRHVDQRHLASNLHGVGASLGDGYKAPVKQMKKSAGWAADLQKYKREKVQLQWSKDHPRDYRQTQFEHSRKQRSFNPITQTFIDTKRESNQRNAERSKRKAGLAKAQERVSSHAYVPYNIVSQQLHPGKKDLPQKTFKKVPDTRTSYDLISQQDKDASRFIDNGPERKRGQAMVEPIGGYLDYNIVSNKYLENHDSREMRDRAAQKQGAKQKFDEKYNFDPIAVRYYDQAKEKNFQSMRAELEKDYGKDQIEWMPNVVKTAEGNLYNIINQDVKHKGRLKAKEDADNSRIYSKAKAQAFEKSVKHRQQEEHDLRNTRKFNRVSNRRENTDRERGYHMISNQSFTGLGSAALPPRRKAPDRPIWQRATDSSLQMRAADPVRSAAERAGAGRLREHRITRRSNPFNPKSTNQMIRSSSAPALSSAGSIMAKSIAPKVPSNPPVPSIQGKFPTSGSGIRTGGF